MATDKVVSVDALSAAEREYVYAGLVALRKIKERRRDSENNEAVRKIYDDECGKIDVLAMKFR